MLRAAFQTTLVSLPAWGRRANSTVSSVFAHQTADIVGSAYTLEDIPPLHGLPEVAVTGRANVGKSTLLNAVMGRNGLVRTSKKAGHTRSLNFYRVGPGTGNLILVDAPGYGRRGRAEWGKLWDHYVQTRAQLRRVYCLINASHGVEEVDKVVLSDLHETCMKTGGTQLTFQAILTKVDLLPTGKLRQELAKIRKDVRDVAPTCLPPLITGKERFGVDEVRKSIVEACGV
ncbi:P-loop containing nucleoside triphosphate hydrolase protein [Heliocybe sulcata]|uniref:P-loop containing nucleoside triphosphate hydrolase protein n=1 Tax=Heliocybe sulcata TaxID=5364 RepID=A0A5C3MUH2_9AGAM|nr:P-loop containing nucleoside triphosphate hydrolase protein [Heliocybe sulcata]